MYDFTRSQSLVYIPEEVLNGYGDIGGELWSKEDIIMGRKNTTPYRFSSPQHRDHREFCEKLEKYKKEQLLKEVKETIFDDIADQLHYEDSNLIQLGNYIGEPTPTQFQAQELNSKVRNRQHIKEDVPLNEMAPNRIKEIIRSEFNHPEYDSVTLHLLIEHYINGKEVSPSQFQEAHKKWRRILDGRNEKIKELELALKEKEAAKTIKWNLHKVVVEELESQIKQLKSNSLSGKLKEEVDKLRIANQEKDIEIQELRDQVTQQAQRWLVPNF
mgnify:CR=1 FL=1